MDKLKQNVKEAKKWKVRFINLWMNELKNKKIRFATNLEAGTRCLASTEAENEKFEDNLLTVDYGRRNSQQVVFWKKQMLIKIGMQTLFKLLVINTVRRHNLR